jgi:hypothetical protein
MADLRTSTLVNDWTCEMHNWIPVTWTRDQCNKCGRERPAPELEQGYDLAAVRRAYSNPT